MVLVPRVSCYRSLTGTTPFCLLMFHTMLFLLPYNVTYMFHWVPMFTHSGSLVHVLASGPHTITFPLVPKTDVNLSNMLPSFSITIPCHLYFIIRVNFCAHLSFTCHPYYYLYSLLTNYYILMHITSL